MTATASPVLPCEPESRSLWEQVSELVALAQAHALALEPHRFELAANGPTIMDIEYAWRLAILIRDKLELVAERDLS